MTNETDIVERLEKPMPRKCEWEMHDFPDGTSEGPFDPLRLEAAALIRDLRGANSSLADTAQNYADAFDKLSNDRWVKDGAYEISNGSLRAEIASLRAENERLRGARDAGIAEGMERAAVSELEKLTFAVQHNPNCPSPWLVRLPGKSLCIDMKPYGDGIGLRKHETGDVLGFGKSFEEAAASAIRAAKEGEK